MAENIDVLIPEYKVGDIFRYREEGLKTNGLITKIYKEFEYYPSDDISGSYEEQFEMQDVLFDFIALSNETFNIHSEVSLIYSNFETKYIKLGTTV